MRRNLFLFCVTGLLIGCILVSGCSGGNPTGDQGNPKENTTDSANLPVIDERRVVLTGNTTLTGIGFQDPPFVIEYELTVLNVTVIPSPAAFFEMKVYEGTPDGIIAREGFGGPYDPVYNKTIRIMKRGEYMVLLNGTGVSATLRFRTKLPDIPPDVTHIPPPSQVHCSPDEFAGWNIPQDKYVFLEAIMGAGGDVLLGPQMRGTLIDFPTYSFEKSSGRLSVGGINPDDKELKMIIGRVTSLGGAAGGGAASHLDLVYEVPAKGILGVDRNGAVCISLRDLANLPVSGNTSRRGPNPFLDFHRVSLFSGEDQPVLLRSGESWRSEVANTSRGGLSIIRWSMSYRVTNYGIRDKGKIGPESR